MWIIRHRVNTIQELRAVPDSLGVEVDVRYHGDRLILHHDPFIRGEDFEEFLDNYRHRFIILNIKSEGIEAAVLSLMMRFKVSDYFFLDLAFPAAMKLVRQGEKKIAVRFSEYEPAEQCLALAGKVEWVWVDCFHQCPLDERSYHTLKRYFKLCIVSPELQGHEKSAIAGLKEKLSAYEISAVCTKHPRLWNSKIYSEK